MRRDRRGARGVVRDGARRSVRREWGGERAAVLVVERRGERERQRGAHGCHGHQQGRAAQGDSGRGGQRVVEALGSVGHEQGTAAAQNTQGSASGGNRRGTSEGLQRHTHKVKGGGGERMRTRLRRRRVRWRARGIARGARGVAQRDDERARGEGGQERDEGARMRWSLRGTRVADSGEECSRCADGHGSSPSAAAAAVPVSGAGRTAVSERRAASVRETSWERRGVRWQAEVVIRTCRSTVHRSACERGGRERSPRQSTLYGECDQSQCARWGYPPRISMMSRYC